MINAKAYDPNSDFVEQAQHVPAEARYDTTLTNVEYFDRSPTITIITFERTIDNGSEKGYVIYDKAFFSKIGSQDYPNAIINAMCIASGVTAPSGVMSAKDYALHWPIQGMRLNCDCVFDYEIVAWVDKNSKKSVAKDPDGGYTNRGVGETDYLKYKKTLYVDAEVFEPWQGEKYKRLAVRRGSYVELPLIYQPPMADTQRAKAASEAKEFTEAQFATDDELPF